MKFNINILFIIVIIACMGCETTGKLTPRQKKLVKIEKTIKHFLSGKKNEGEVFRVLLSSEKYTVKQMSYNAYITRSSDTGGDSYMKEEIKKHDKINEVREGVLKIWLYPDSGRIMKIRPEKSTFFMEIDKILSEDIQRWSFKFPKNVVVPTKMTIKYLVVLRKKMSDADIIKEMRKND